jgi:hypothetical protein
MVMMMVQSMAMLQGMVVVTVKGQHVQVTLSVL